MSLHFEKAFIADIRQETADCISIAFTIPENVQEKFQYQHGQYLTLRTYINGEEVRRSYSLCSSPLDNEWRIAVKQIPGGVFSSFAASQLQVGDSIDLMPPMGKFYTEVKKANAKQYVGVAAGSGITPVISIIKTVLATEPRSSFTLVYGNRDRHSIIFKEELESLKNKYMDRFRIIHILSREITDAALHSGRIDATKCDTLFTKLIDIRADEFFICGPEEMIFCVKDYLEGRGVDKKKIHFELFTASSPKHSNTVHSAPADERAKSKITITLDGRSFDFDLAYKDDSILDAAMKEGADLPYACRGGVCCTCKAKLIEGKVDMEVNYGLEPDELKAGFILTCQSHPVSERVVIDFDVK